ncbi:protein-glutamate O-methyltransferase CheR [Telmatospirillum sp.]|uniref:CheR family methyltransferase n=1 Tax=Telmatospirillum sp. TaxID=2079197 RepID=UPI00284FC472|nr:protein-glutamate O-methyltransferase CheR [Telmatospirillum sp.]MDR3437991.1 protein-glutamate O-methyltransferase CheR [Telmatospirillum sp.]
MPLQDKMARVLYEDGDRLTHHNFQQLATFIEETAGIRMPPVKKTMVEGRLRRRVRSLGLNSLEDYCAYLFRDGWIHDEAVHLIDAITTNKTDFFREPEHFHLLIDQIVPELLSRRDRPGLDKPLKVWSAASSIGAEPYTLAMVLDDFGRLKTGFRFSILATDICTEVLVQARHAVYPADMAAPIPLEFQRRYLMRGRGSLQGSVRVRPEIRQTVAFGRLNLMDEDYPVNGPYDVIFCRNILIYFDKATQEAVLRRLCRHLRPEGYLFVGHSETVTGLDLPLRALGSAVYRKK